MCSEQRGHIRIVHLLLPRRTDRDNVKHLLSAKLLVEAVRLLDTLRQRLNSGELAVVAGIAGKYEYLESCIGGKHVLDVERP